MTLGPELWVGGQPQSVLGLVLLGGGVGYFAGLFGVGGGFIMTPLLVVLFDVPLPIAVGSGLCQMVGTAFVTLLRHRKLGQSEPRIGLLLLPGCLLGVELGAQLLSALSRAGSASLFGSSVPWVTLALEPAYAVLLVAVGLSYAAHAREGSGALAYLRPGALSRAALGPTVDLPGAGLRGVSSILLSYVGLGLGIVSGLLGIGGGVVLNPILVYGLGLPIRLAAGSSIAVMLATALVGTLSHALRGNVHLGLSMVLLLGGTISAQIGALSSRRLSATTLGWLQAAVILAAAGAVVWHVAAQMV